MPIPGIIPSVYPLTVPRDCILYLDMQDTGLKVIDHSGRGNHGTVSGWPEPRVGPSGWTRYFDGTDDAVDCGANLNLVGDVTVEAWIKPDPQNSLAVVFAESVEGARENFQVSFTSLTGCLKITHTGFEVLLSTTTLSDAWYHAVATRILATGAFKLYLNGTLDKANTTAAPLTEEPTAVTVIGGCVNSLGPPVTYNRIFTGNIGITRVYSRALTAVEVLTAYRADAWRYGLKG